MKMLFFQHSACRHFSSSVSTDRAPLETKTTPSQGLIRSAEVFGGVENSKHKIQDKERERKQSPIDLKAFNLFNDSVKHCTGAVAQISTATLRRCKDSSSVPFFGCFFTPNVHLPSLYFGCNTHALVLSHK